MLKWPNRPQEIRLGDWKFQMIDMKHKGLFSQYIKETDYPMNLFSSNFDFIWGVSHPYYGMILWRKIDGLITVFRLTSQRTLHLAILPFGKGNPDKIAEITFRCLKFCSEWNKGKMAVASLRAMNDLQLACLKRSSLFERFFRTVQEMGVERHVGIHNLLELKGNDFKNVRSTVNRFRRDYPNAMIRRARSDDYPALLELKKQWNQSSGRKYRTIWDDVFYLRIIRNHQELGHIVLIAEIEGRIAGMISGGILPHGEAWACELKRMEQFNGISDFLYVEFAKEINRLDPKASTINFGRDLGAKGGLRAYKDKFRPVLNCTLHSLYLK